MLAIFPSAPLLPKPPGTIIPEIPCNASSAVIFPSSISDVSIHLMLILQLFATAACSIAFKTDA